ncbi:hypothetical protein DVH24_002922 [Malus domestica]|uniref:Reverse transcriptase zinc-binding domain-containing protein n=1 Tax=Malus domestica TaxID=3750 RepID=A0A498K951_MALDO|nr:hypothetical protein DVH24_002922 [Malus domestica]
MAQNAKWSIKSDFLWKQVLTLSVPNKIKHFVWRCLIEFIRCNFNLSQKKEKAETSLHSLWGCGELAEFWMNFIWWDACRAWRVHSFKELWGAMVLVLKMEELELFAMVCWDIWNDRNDMVYEKYYLEKPLNPCTRMNHERSNKQRSSTLSTRLMHSYMQGRIHSGVVGVERPLGNHGNNLEAPICDLLELGSSGSSGRGRRRLGRKRKKKQLARRAGSV